MHDIRERIRNTRPTADALPPLDIESVARRARRQTVLSRGASAMAAVAVLAVAVGVIDLLPQGPGVDVQPAAPGETTTDHDVPGWDVVAPGSLEIDEVEARLGDPAEIEIVAELDAERWAPQHFVAFDATSGGDVIAYDPEERRIVALDADGEHRTVSEPRGGLPPYVSALQIGPDGWHYLIGSERADLSLSLVQPIDEHGDLRPGWHGPSFWSGIVFVGDTGWVQTDDDRWTAIVERGVGAVASDDRPDRATPPDGLDLSYDYGDATSTDLSTYVVDGDHLDRPARWELQVDAFNSWAGPYHDSTTARRLVIVDQHAEGRDDRDSLALVFDADGTAFGLRIDIAVAPAFDGIGTSPARIAGDGRLYWSWHRDDGTVEIARYPHPLPDAPRIRSADDG